MSTDPDALDSLFNSDVKDMDVPTSGPWAAELNQLVQRSSQAAAAGSLAVTNKATYDQLIAVVKQGSAEDLSEAQLTQRIQALGSDAVAIAKTVGGLAKLFP